MKRRITGVIAAVFLALTLLQLPALAADYADMPQEENWAYAALEAAVENGLLQGSGGLLHPSEDLTRAQLAAILNRAFGATETAAIRFADVSAGDWFAADIAKAVCMGTFQGDGSQMRPNDPITRQEAFAALARAFRLESGSAGALSAFTDSAQVSSWAVPSLSALVSAGYIQGSGGLLRPLDNITRAEFAQVMYTLVKSYISEAGEYTALPGGTVLIRAAGVTLRGLTVKGDLIVGDGVGSGDVTLDGVTVEGRLLVRGGGEHSVHIIGGTTVDSLVIGKTASGGVRVRTDEASSVRLVYVADGNDDVILEGSFTQIAVETASPVVLRNAAVESLTISAAGSGVTLESGTTVKTVSIPDDAAGATLTVEQSAAVTSVTSAAESVTITGAGKVSTVTVSGNNTAVDVNAGEINVETGTTGTTQNGGEAGSSGSGNTGGGSSPVIPYIPERYAATVTTAEEFLQALGDPYCTAITVKGDVCIEDETGRYTFDKPVTVADGAWLSLSCSHVTNASTLTIASESAGFSVSICSPDSSAVFTNSATIDNGGSLSVGGGVAVVNSGTIHNRGSFSCYVSGFAVNPDDPETTYIRVGGMDFTNTGTINNEGSLWITWGDNPTFTNSGTLTSSGSVNVLRPVVNSGNITVSGGDVNIQSGTGNGGSSYAAGLINRGTVTVEEGCWFGVSGEQATLTNEVTGIITIIRGGMGVNESASAANQGAIVITGLDASLDIGENYVNDENDLVCSAAAMTNSGTITINSADDFTEGVEGGSCLVVHPDSTLTNTGVIHIGQGNDCIYIDAGGSFLGEGGTITGNTDGVIYGESSEEEAPDENPDGV